VSGRRYQAAGPLHLPRSASRVTVNAMFVAQPAAAPDVSDEAGGARDHEQQRERKFRQRCYSSISA